MKSRLSIFCLAFVLVGLGGCSQRQPLVYEPPKVTGRQCPAGSPIGANTISDTAAEAMKSVVNVATKTSIVVPEQGYSYFGPFDGQRAFPQGLVEQVEGTGTGVIVRADGYILTNNHVVGEANRITVTLHDNRNFEGTVIGRDKLTDLAVIKIPASNLPVARLGMSHTLRPGDWAIAIGSPAGLSNSVTLGIISALGRSLGEQLGHVSFIQTDTAINPGNSGGPLLNLNGEVIGINTAIRKDFQNIGFAVPVDTAKDVLQQILANGSAQHPYLGIAMQDLNERLNQALGLPPATRGVIIAKVGPATPASNAGLRAGDIIQSVDGTNVDAAADVQKWLGQHHPGDKLDMQISRGGTAMKFAIVVGDYPES